MPDSILVTPGSGPGLADRDPRDDLGLDKEAAKARTDELRVELADLQERLWAENERAVLLVLQGMDTSGKDSTVRRVFAGVNPQGVAVTSFKVPSEEERDHDYLWRVHRACPGRGSIGVFNRSHYEDVGVVRVMGWIDEATCRQRYRQIVDFERHLVENGTVVRKVFLHIARDEQRQRLQDRLDDPTKRWKFNPGDLDARARWGEYQQAYEDAIAATSTDDAPWYVVPADRKWVRDHAVAELLVSTLRSLDPQAPDPVADLDDVTIPT